MRRCRTRASGWAASEWGSTAGGLSFVPSLRFAAFSDGRTVAADSAVGSRLDITPGEGAVSGTLERPVGSWPVTEEAKEVEERLASGMSERGLVRGVEEMPSMLGIGFGNEIDLP